MFCKSLSFCMFCLAIFWFHIDLFMNTISTVKFLKVGHRKYCCNHPKIQTKRLYNRVMGPKDADGMANSVYPDSTLIWVYTVFSGLSVRELGISFKKCF